MSRLSVLLPVLLDERLICAQADLRDPGLRGRVGATVGWAIPRRATERPMVYEAAIGWLFFMLMGISAPTWQDARPGDRPGVGERRSPWR
jgi:hypothetical protein